MSNDVIECPNCEEGLLQFLVGPKGTGFYCDRCNYFTESIDECFSESRIDNERYRKRIME